MSRIIIDCDPGVDDSLAIALAVSSSLNILGVTTVYGNVSVNQATTNAQKVISLLNSYIPVYKGSTRPMVNRSKRASSHGIDGLGELDITLEIKNESIDAIEFISKQTKSFSDGMLDILAIGPLTNIARLIKKTPAKLNNINQIIVMAGCIDAPGNITNNAEFNAYNDPLALKTVLDSGLNIVLIPADVCRKVVFTNQTFDQLTSPILQNAMKKLASAYISYYQKDKDFGNFKGGVMYDLLAVAYRLRPNLFTTIFSNVNVCTEIGENYGLTTLSEGNRCIVARDVDFDGLERLFIETLNCNSSIK